MTSTSPLSSATTGAPVRWPPSAVKPVTDPSAYGVVILDRDTRVRGFQEKPTRDEARSDLANCGIYVIEAELLDRIPAKTFYDFGTDVARARGRQRGGLRVHDDGLLERRRRPRRAPQHDPRRRARARARGRSRRGDRSGRLGGGRGARSPIRPGWTARSCSGPASSSTRSAQVRGPAAIGADCRVGKGAAIRSAALLPGTAVPDEGLAIAGIFGDAAKLADAVLRYPASR